MPLESKVLEVCEERLPPRRRSSDQPIDLCQDLDEDVIIFSRKATRWGTGEKPFWSLSTGFLGEGGPEEQLSGELLASPS